MIRLKLEHSITPQKWILLRFNLKMIRLKFSKLEDVIQQVSFQSQNDTIKILTNHGIFIDQQGFNLKMIRLKLRKIVFLGANETRFNLKMIRLKYTYRSIRRT